MRKLAEKGLTQEKDGGTCCPELGTNHTVSCYPLLMLGNYRAWNTEFMLSYFSHHSS